MRGAACVCVCVCLCFQRQIRYTTRVCVCVWDMHVCVCVACENVIKNVRAILKLNSELKVKLKFEALAFECLEALTCKQQASSLWASSLSVCACLHVSNLSACTLHSCNNNETLLTYLQQIDVASYLRQCTCLTAAYSRRFTLRAVALPWWNSKCSNVINKK